MTLSWDEFLRRFLLHLLPKGFTLLPLCFAALDSIPPPIHLEVSADPPSRDLRLCPHCGAPMVIVERLTPTQIQFRSPPIFITVAA